MLAFAWFKKKKDKYDEFDDEEYDEDYDEDYDDEDYDDEDYDDDEEDDEDEDDEDTSKYDYEAIAGNFERENTRLFKDNERLKRKLAMAEEELKMTALEKNQLLDKAELAEKDNQLDNQSTKKQLSDTIALYTKISEENKSLKNQLEKLNTYGFDVIETEKKLAKYHVIERENTELKAQLMNVKVDLADAVLNAKEMAKDIVNAASEEANNYQIGIETKRAAVTEEINDIYHELDHSRLKLNNLFNEVRSQVDLLKDMAEGKERR